MKVNDPPAKLIGGFLGERDGDNSPGMDSVIKKPGYPMLHAASLSTSCSCQNNGISTLMGHNQFLILIEKII
jgi:hypothetical protein